MAVSTFYPYATSDSGSIRSYQTMYMMNPNQSLDTSIIACHDVDSGGMGYDIDTYSAFIRFPLTNISQGDDFSTIHLRLKCKNDWESNCVGIKVTAIDEDSPSAPSTYSEYVNASRTASSYIWNWAAAGEDEYSSAEFITIDVTSPVREVINRVNWDGSAIVLLLESFIQSNDTDLTLYQEFEKNNSLPFIYKPRLQFLDTVFTNLTGEIHRYEPGMDIGSDEVLTDFISSNRKHGWIRPGAGFSNTGITGKALEFSGAGTKSFVKIMEDTNLSGKTDFSISFFMYSHSVSGNRPIISQGDFGSSTGAFNVRANGTVMEYSVKDWSLDFNFSSATANVWDHYAFTYSNINGGALYKNGSNQIANFPTGTAGSVPLVTLSTYLGKDPTNLYDGFLDSIRIFNKILSTTEINALSSTRGYNGTPGASTGFLSKTIDDILLSATSINGSITNLDLDVTLDNVILSSSGTVLSSIIADLNVTLDNIVLSSSAEQISPVIGNLGVTLDDITLSSSIDKPNEAVFTTTLDPILLSSFSVTEEEASAILNLTNIALASESIIAPKGGVDQTLANIILSAEGIAPNRAVFTQTLANLLLDSFVVEELEGDLSETVSISLNSVAEGSGSSNFTNEITLQMSATGESVRFAGMYAETVISVLSEGKNFIEGNLSLTLDDILSQINNDGGDLSITLDVLTLVSTGASLISGQGETVITVSMSSEAHPPIEAGLTEILDDVILLQTHNYPPIPDDDNSPLLDSCPSHFIGETDATFCSRS